MSDKCRVYVCLYFQQGVTSVDPARFHWGLWVEPKQGRGHGDYFHVQSHQQMRTSRGTVPAHWAYDSSVTTGKTPKYSKSNYLIGRILIGKLPAGYNATHVHAVCQGVPPPSITGRDTCKTWTGNAVRALQHQRYLSDFSWTQVSADFEAKGRSWWAKDGKRPSGQGEKHMWDYFGIEKKAHCVVM
ncbi:hypothetical protein F5883DRAFT_659111 [Diaporthe sp. PMI_573]|jgi:hypothetical protein|nr:hypothetical protein F5883DRAFT_659111 [Diaporthaceae sp. PMI_573]